MAPGVEPEDFESEPLEIWPDNARAFNLFASVRTQWRVGLGGVVGLDYGVVDSRIDRLRLPDEEREEIEAEIQIMEFAVLDVLRQ
mgnify:CR=1 FL=1